MDYPLDLRDLDKLLRIINGKAVVTDKKSICRLYSLPKLDLKVNRALLRLLFEPKLRDYNYPVVQRSTGSGAADSRSTVFIHRRSLFARMI